MRTTSALLACLLSAALAGAVLAGCGTAVRIPVDMGKVDMVIMFPGCDNGSIDSGETDIDCGGPMCTLKCAEGQMCKSKTDCATGVCIMGTCFSATICSDTVQNGDETGIDCGGSCAPCTFGGGCAKPTDCLSGVCTASKCAALKAALDKAKPRGMGVNPLNVDVADFDGDGKLDLVSLSGTDDKAAIALGKGDGTFNNPIFIDVPRAESPDTLAAGDVDGDGKGDIVYTNAGKIVVLLNDTMTATMPVMIHFKKEVSMIIGSDPGSPQLRDLDGDGKLDLIFADTSYDAGANGYNIYLAGNMEGGKWKVLQKLFADADRPSSVFLADFNDDKFIDVAAIFGGKVNVKLQKADQPKAVNTFGAWKSSVTGMLTPTQIIAADFDPDFFTDVVVLDRNAGAYGVMRGDGMGLLLKPTKMMVMNGPARMALLDFDLDGQPDFATANYDNDNAGVLLGQGQRVFMQGPVALANPSPTYIISRDINKDGKPDIVVCNPGTDMVTVVLNKSG